MEDLEKLLEDIEFEVRSTREDFRKLEKGNKTAARRLRKQLLNIKTLSHIGRKYVTRIVKTL